MKTNRRQFFQTMGAGAAGLTLASPLYLTSCAAPGREDDGQILFIGDNIAVAETTYGKVKGYILRDIYYFLGIPYGANTTGSNRFMPPQKPEPWTEVFPAVWWGNTAPQNMENRYANKYQSFQDAWNYDDVSENCLTINVYTPGYNDGRKRPVMLWLHGGGFTNGNGIEQNGYYGENFARLGDVVFCSINHRLGPMGYTNLAGVGGEKYAASGNAGMLDIVASLEWIRDNIENFGGDPNNVTIMGQSGGGAKVTTTTAMPVAKGLFHKAVVLSGAGLQSGDKEYSERLGAYVLREAGLSPAQIDRLQEMPWQDYYALATAASQKLTEDMAGAQVTGRRGFSPVVDGLYLPQHPYYPEPTPLAADVPMIICSTMNESAVNRDDASLEDITLDGVKERLQSRYGERTSEIVDAYAKNFPDKRPIEIWSMTSSTRQSLVALADQKSRQDAPVYVAWFCWQPPLFDGRQRAFHCSDISFWFYNTDVMLTHTGGGARPRALSAKMANALLAFMKTGDPNGSELPQWSPYTRENGETMVLDDVSGLQNDPDREARKALPPLYS
ncbi:MAG: carboxylesterase/lipase family protein [Bacteroidales bacterium]|nr:carboxylesterase/lipase family protein [Bacteroidales bacterium]